MSATPEAEADATQAITLASVAVTVTPTTATLALAQTINDLRNHRALAALQLTLALIITMVSARWQWPLVPVPLTFLYLAIDRWGLTHRNIRDLTQIRKQVDTGESLTLEGSSLVVGSGATHHQVTLRRPTMRALAGRVFTAAPLTALLRTSDRHRVSTLVAENTLAPLLQTQARMRAALLVASVVTGLSAILQSSVGGFGAGVATMFLLGGAWRANRRLRQGQRVLSLLNDGGIAVIAAENLVVQRGEVRAAFALKPSSLHLLTRTDVPQARALLRKP
ncbi:MAG: hypothetical protein KBG15_12340 [Kofleriaceae bacterium]|nr:hypothetical protein [Kofleriaceae bacterium]